MGIALHRYITQAKETLSLAMQGDTTSTDLENQIHEHMHSPYYHTTKQTLHPPPKKITKHVELHHMAISLIGLHWQTMQTKPIAKGSNNHF